MQPTTSAKTLDIQANIKVAEVKEIIYHYYYFYDKTWSVLPTAWFTITVAKGLIATTRVYRSLYI